MEYEEMQTRRAALLVAALVLLSALVGTASLSVDPAPDPSADSDATDAGATTESGTTAATTPGNGTPSDSAATTATTRSINASLPPGVNTTGVEDPSALVTAHRTALNTTSFAFRFRANVSVGPANQWTIQSGRVEPGLSPLVVHSDSFRRFAGGTDAVATDLWANETGVVVRYQRGNRSEIRWYERDGGNLADETWAHLPRADLDSQVTQSWLIELALTVGEYEYVGTERRDGREVAILRATRPAAAANFTELNATVVVDREGRVHSLSLYAAYAGDNETRIRYEFELTEIGNASVSRPKWVGAAIPPNRTAGNATTTLTETPTNTRRAANATTATTNAS